MSEKDSYLPGGDKKRVVWLRNFATKLPAYSTSLSLTAAEVTAISNDYAAFAYMVDVVEIEKADAKRKVAFKNMLASGGSVIAGTAYPAAGALPTPPPVMVAPGIFRRLPLLVQRIKHHPNYNITIGHDLGIIASTVKADLSSAVPTLVIGLKAGSPSLKWRKGPSDCVEIFVNRKDGAGFVLLTIATGTTYTDPTPLTDLDKDAEVWEYKAIYRKKNERIGSFSNTVSITVTKV